VQYTVLEGIIYPKDKEMYVLLYNNIVRNIAYYQKIGRFFNYITLSVLCRPRLLVTIRGIYIWYELVRD
jgi:hypothetical protein